MGPDGVSVSTAAINQMMPMHVQLDGRGQIAHIGPTLAKLDAAHIEVGAPFFDFFELRRPPRISNLRDLRRVAGQPLRLRLRDPFNTPLAGLAALLPETGGLLINLSFGITIVESLRRYPLTSTDFAQTDIAVEMMFLSEAHTAVMGEWHKLYRRLDGARSAAERDAATDTLTGLSNRRALEDRAARLISADLPFSLMAVDLDYFKAVNDTLGHAAGDIVLQHVARILRSVTRGHDTVARIGGDEFVILLLGETDPAAVKVIAERLLKRLNEPIKVDDEVAQISGSLGAVSSLSYDTPDLEEMIRDADAALYASKKDGRSRLTIR
ncbi:MAG: GGDEF domain-containing protein [Pseudomonadota bacterium]